MRERRKGKGERKGTSSTGNRVIKEGWDGSRCEYVRDSLLPFGVLSSILNDLGRIARNNRNVHGLRRDSRQKKRPRCRRNEPRSVYTRELRSKGEQIPRNTKETMRLSVCFASERNSGHGLICVFEIVKSKLLSNSVTYPLRRRDIENDQSRHECPTNLLRQPHFHPTFQRLVNRTLREWRRKEQRPELDRLTRFFQPLEACVLTRKHSVRRLRNCRIFFIHDCSLLISFQ